MEVRPERGEIHWVYKQFTFGIGKEIMCQSFIEAKGWTTAL